jgi:polyisoprenoid-binding protein YceI
MFPVRKSTMLATLGATVLAGLSLGAGTSKAADVYKVDPVHSSVIFRVKHMNTSYAWGRFDDFAGSLSLDSSQSKLQFQIKTASVDTNNANRDNHLRSPDFFNAVQFPTIGFVSKSVTQKGNAYEVVGDMTLHGVTRPLTFKLIPTGTGKDMKGNAIAGFEASFTLSQKEFGITKMAAAIGDEVWVIVGIETIKQ